MTYDKHTQQLYKVDTFFITVNVIDLEELASADG